MDEIPSWVTGAEFVPKLLVKGVAPNGREYDLIGWGNWTAEEKIDVSSLFERSKMNRREVRSFWEWAGRTDSMPKTLSIYLAANPEYFRWILIGDAGKFLYAKLADDETTIKNRLIDAFANKRIRTVCGHFEVTETHQKAHHVRVHTMDLIRWAAQEYNLTIKLSDLFSDEGPTSIIGILWPKYEHEWPELDGEGNLKGLHKLY